MAEIFSNSWMGKFKDLWNSESELVRELANIKFNSTIAYGFISEELPRGMIQVQKGKIVSATEFADENIKPDELDWDLRAELADWKKWIQQPPGMMALGMAYCSRSLKFKRGDYASMIKDPRMATPFVKSFSLMSRV